MTETTPAWSPSEAIRHIAKQLGDPKVDRGLLATLRRFHPVTHGRHSILETTRVLQAAGVPDRSTDDFQRWAIVVHCLALVRGAHSDRDPGETLADMGFSEGRFKQLLEADSMLLFDLLPSLALRANSSGRAMDWWPLAKLLLNADVNEKSAQEARAWLARGYIRGRPSPDDKPG